MDKQTDKFYFKNLLMRTLHLFLLLFLLTNCSNNKPEKITDLFPPSETISHEVLKEDVLNLPYKIIYRNGYLIISDFKSDSIISIYNIQKNEIETQFLTIGGGPNETVDYPGSEFMLNDTTLIWLDAVSSIRKAVFSDNMKEVKSVEKICDLKRQLNVMDIVPLATGKYVAAGRFEKGFYALLNSKGEVESYKYDYPADNVKIDNSMKGFIYQGEFVSNPDNTKFAFFTYQADIIEFFKVNDQGGFDKQKEYHFKYPKYSQEPMMPMPMIEDGSICFLKGCATEKFIYLLYSGKKMSELKSFTESQTVLVFNWKGKPVKHYNLDIIVSTIAVDENDKVLYATTNNPEGTLVSFKL